ncbi:glutamate receptor 1-like [Aethina tumida]|uniref:glutamate receptor 1-like n=1 Tax=Aethina tumida TaxID=116153 RepID=UPI00214808E3|nr:glutamate receptor 1-like [Aethina tumida]
MDFGVGSHVYTVTKIGIEYKITSLYKLTFNSTNLIENDLGTWSYFGGISMAYHFSNVRNRSNLMGLPLGVSYVIINPDTLNHLDDYREKHIDSITKNNYILTNHLIETMNATIVPTYRSSWGYYNQTTNSYDGVIGDLQSGLAEIGGTPSFITIDRLKIVDFTVSTTKTYLRFIYRDPPLTYVTNIFTLPFDTYVWYACFVVFGVVMVATYVIVYWEWKDPIFSETLNCHDFIAPLKPDICEICIAEVGLITQQGTECEPKSNGGRIATKHCCFATIYN